MNSFSETQLHGLLKISGIQWTEWQPSNMYKIFIWIDVFERYLKRPARLFLGDSSL